MSWVPFAYVWIVELMALAVVIGLAIETVVSNSRKIQDITELLRTSLEKVQFLFGKINEEFELISNRAKLIKDVFLKVGTFYKEVAVGSAPRDEAVQKAKNIMPPDLRIHASSLFNITGSGAEARRKSSAELHPELKKATRHSSQRNFQDVHSA